MTGGEVDQQLELLRGLDSCAVSDALDRHGIRGALLGLRPLVAARSAAGRAVTVRLGEPEGPVPARHLGTAAVGAAGPDDVIVVAHSGRLDCAGWGGLLSRAAAIRGIAGVVIDGAARDVTEAGEVGLALYARAATPVTARGRVVELSWDEAVTIDGITVKPGDLVLADASGVVVVPGADADAVLATATQIAATERAMADAIDAGKPVADVMGSSYESLTSRAASDD